MRSSLAIFFPHIYIPNVIYSAFLKNYSMYHFIIYEAIYLCIICLIYCVCQLNCHNKMSHRLRDLNNRNSLLIFLEAESSEITVLINLIPW